MFKDLSLQKRITSLMLGLDATFTVLFSMAYSFLLGVSPGRVAVLAGAQFLLRALLVSLRNSQVAGPTDAIHAQARDASRPVHAESLRSADRLLQNAPLKLAMTEALLWGSQIPVNTAFALQAGDIGLQTGAELVTALLGIAGTIGSLGISTPMIDWLISEFLGRNAVLASKLGIELDRLQRPVSRRIVGLALAFSACPAVAMSAVGISAHVRDLANEARTENEAVLGELRSRPADAEGKLVLSKNAPAQGRVTVFSMSRTGEIRTAGAPAPAWLQDNWIRQAERGVSLIPERGTYARLEPVSDGSVIGSVVRIDAISREFMFAAFTAGLTLALWAPICAWLMAQSVARPLVIAATAVRRIAEQGDLSKMGSLPVAQHDEVGVLLVKLNQLVDTMRALAEASSNVGSGNLNVEIQGRGELPDAFRKMLTGLKEGVEQLHGTSAELQSAAAEIFAATQEQEAAATSQSSGMVEVAQTMDSLSKSAVHVAESVQGVFQNAERTLENTDQMVTRIGALTGQANRIADILEVIRDIADRSDLLALNGSLEATRAGEAGRGFALVAAEMRRLAERVAASVNDIKALVADIRASGASTVVATEESKKLAQKTAETARNIALVTQQQRTSTEQVTQSVRSVAEVVAQAASATMQTRSSAEGLRSHAERLSDVVRRFQLQA